MSCCKGKKACVRNINKLCWELGLSIDQAATLDGVLYLFILTDSDGKKIPFKYGVDLERFLLDKRQKAKGAT